MERRDLTIFCLFQYRSKDMNRKLSEAPRRYVRLKMIRSLASFLVLPEAFKKSLFQSLLRNNIYVEFLEVNTSISY